MWGRIPTDQIKLLIATGHDGAVVFANPPEDATDGTVMVCCIKTNNVVITGRVCFIGNRYCFRCILPTPPSTPESLDLFARCSFYSDGKLLDIITRLLEAVPDSTPLIAPHAYQIQNSVIAFTDDVEAYLADMRRRNLWWGTEWVGDQRELDAHLMTYIRSQHQNTDSDKHYGLMIRYCTSDCPGYLFHVLGLRTLLFVTFNGTWLLVRSETEEIVLRCKSTTELHDSITKTRNCTLLPRVARVLDDFKEKRAMRYHVC